MRIFDLGTCTAAEDEDPPSRRLRAGVPSQKADSLYFLVSRHSEIGGSRSSSQLQRFIYRCWDEMQAVGLTWKPSVSTLRRALKLFDRETSDPDRIQIPCRPPVRRRLARLGECERYTQVRVARTSITDF